MNLLARLHPLLAGLGAAAALVAVTTAAQAQTKWDLPAAYPANNFHTENLQQFANDVDKATNGKLKITVHANASLFKAPEIKRAVQGGQARSARSCCRATRTSGRSSASTASRSSPTATPSR